MSDALARNADPATAHEAADKVDVQARETDVIVALVMHGPMNAKEIAAKIGRDRDSISPRMKGLIAKGLVELTGEKRDGQQVYIVKRKML
jgi:predicted transcriptional regulator